MAPHTLFELSYEQPLFRPPSEWRSLILQLTLGCSHNRCSFCAMYRSKRFRVRRLEQLQREIDAVAAMDPQAVDRVFLADGDALVVKTQTLLAVLAYLKKSFPRLRRVNAYASPQNLLRKSPGELRSIHEAGLHMLYIGLESGAPKILDDINKGVDPDAFVKACARGQQAGFKLSLTVLNNIVAPERSAEHVEGTVAVVNRVVPDYLACLTLIPGPAAEPHAAATGWRSMHDHEVLDELAAIIAGVDVDGVEFRANHASNPLPIRGRLRRDRGRLLNLLAQARNDEQFAGLRPVWMRGL